ncbi:MAG TPA: AI-2E family transporter [Candidatus Peribacteria bacterium]|nr:AI-2E family transporter [Candidatus Peribacteria bacterium]
MAKQQPKNPRDSFKSFQILSDRAQKLWTKAKIRVQESQDTKRRLPPGPSTPEGPKETVVIEIEPKTVAVSTMTILLVLIGAWMLWSLHDVLLVLVLSFFLSIVIDSSVRFFERLKIPRAIAVMLVYIIFLSLAVFLIISLIPIVATEVQNFARFLNNRVDVLLTKQEITLPFLSDALNIKLTAILQEALRNLEIKDQATTLFNFGQNLSTAAQSWLTYAIGIAGSVFNFIASFFLILILTFFIQMERESIVDYFRFLLPRGYRNYYDTKADAIYHKMSQWFQGQIMLCLSIGILTFIALSILGMPYSFTLALLAGFTEFIPVAGPLIAAIPAVFIALTQAGFVWGLVIALVYYVIQTCENNLLVPLIMKHAVGLSPIVIMVGMLVGISFPTVIHPILGIILAVPLTTVISIFMSDIRDFRRHQ